jgi:ABC-type ATPase with predicted acetyltransferase domain
MSKVPGIPFKKGDPRINKNGRGKGSVSIPDLLRRIGNETITAKDGRKLTKLEAVMTMVYKNAIEGHAWAVEFIASYTEGKPTQKVNFEQEGQPLIVQFVKADHAPANKTPA